MNNENVSFSLQSGKSKKKKNARTEKAYEIDCAEVCFWMSWISFTIDFNKAGKILCFTRKATSQVLIKEMLLGGGDLKVIVKLSWVPELHCDVMFWLLFKLFGKYNK